MPVDSHLQFAEIREFHAGLWTVSDQIMPPNAAQQMTDCYASPGGGLRAWYKPGTLTTTGIANPASEVCTGIFGRGGVPNRVSGPSTVDYYMTTYRSADGFVRLYRMDLTANAVAWTLIKTFGAGSAPHFTTWTNYHLNSGADHVLMSLFAASADDGVWAINYADGVMTKIVASPWAGPITIHQSRVMVSENLAPFRTTFSDPGVETGLGTNIITTESSRMYGQNTGICSFSPGDLLIQKMGAPFFLVEGDLSNYTLRQMTDSKSTNGWNSCAFAPMGVIWAITLDGVYESPDGQLMFPLSKNLASININPQSVQDAAGSRWANVQFIKHWLMLGSGHVYDYDTKCWFKSSFLGSGNCLTQDRFGQTLVAATNGTNFSIFVYDTTDDTAHRAEAYTWQSAPLRDPNGRQVEIRAVDIVARSRNGATSTITVTVNGVARTIACDSTGRGAITFYYMARREELDITVTAASNAAGVEAPMIEAVRIGSQGGHFLTTGADVG